MMAGEPGQRTVWVGFVHVAASRDSDVLEGALGAYVWAAAPAKDERDFEERVAEEGGRLGLDVVSVEDVRPALSSREARARRVSHGAVARRARASGLVEWDAFHAYEDERGSG